VLHNPEPRPANPVQIIFVHGLNGSKRRTWTHSESKFNWPEWLRNEKGLQNVRIATFGYNSSSNVLAPNSNLSIPDFANQLLLYLDQLNYRDGSVCVPLTALTVGSDYIIEAFNNPDYASLHKDIVAVVFLGTPHQGSDLARILDVILTASFSSRNFVEELHPNSDVLEAINHNFRHRVEKLKLISFFETENTRLNLVGFKIFICSFF
jgi:hypothetical protein